MFQTQCLGYDIDWHKSALEYKLKHDENSNTNARTQVRKTEESLSRLRRLRASDKKGNSNQDDSTSKITRQLHLDLDFFKEQLMLLLSEENYITKATRTRLVDAVRAFRGRIWNGSFIYFFGYKFLLYKLCFTRPCHCRNSRTKLPEDTYSSYHHHSSWFGRAICSPGGAILLDVWWNLRERRKGTRGWNT